MNPVHQITFDTSMIRPSSTTGYPFLTPVIRGTRSMPAEGKSFRRTRPRGIPRGGSRKWSRSFLPSAVFTVNRVATNHIMGVSRWSRRLPARAGSCPVSGPDNHVWLMRSELDGDLRSGVAGAHDEHGAFLNLGWVAALLRVELDDALIQIACE